MTATAIIAAARRLRPTTVAHFRLHDVLTGSAGTVYPVIYQGQEVGRRWKATPAYYEQTKRRGHSLKYQTLGAAPHFPIYNLDAVRPGESATLAAGEADVWVLHQAGLIAVSFLFGEGCVPGQGVRLLAEHRPSLVSICYDVDEAGRAGAERAYHALTAAGLQATIAILPAWIGHKGDVSDLYRLLGHDDAMLRGALDRLPRHSPPPRRPEPTAYPGRPVSTSGGVFARARGADIVALASRLTELRPRAGGRYSTGLCPFHDDHHPSFVVYPGDERGPGRFCCHPCGLRGDVIELARLALERGLLS